MRCIMPIILILILILFLADLSCVPAYASPSPPQAEPPALDSPETMPAPSSPAYSLPLNNQITQEVSGERKISPIFLASSDALIPGETSALVTMQDIQQIVVGSDHTCALTTAGNVKCWGVNNDGQLGIGTDFPRSIPTDVIDLSNDVIAIAAGWRHTCALTTTGGVKCWGDNEYGQLGNGDTMDKLTPVSVVGLSSGVAAIGAGRRHTCALTKVGAVKCWGNNEYGQLGTGTTTSQLMPTPVIGLNNGITSVSVGRRHTCALTATGGIKCWGYNLFGQVGNGSNTNQLTPTNVTGLSSGVAVISAGNYHTCALTTEGGAKCWGNNEYHQLGDGSSVSKSTPVNVTGLTSGTAAIAPGRRHTCALTVSGRAMCWGDNEYSQLGDGSAVSRPIPTNVAGLSSGAAAVSAGRTHTCALAITGQSKCWGNNQDGQLGDGSTVAAPAPIDVKTDQCHALTLTHSGNGSDPVGSPQRAVTCPTNYYIDGTMVTLTAAPETGWQVASWQGTDNNASTSLTNTLIMPTSDHTAGVIYERQSTQPPTTTNYYLPAISKNPITTPPPVDFPQLVNGNFEQGDNGAWDTYSSSQQPLITTSRPEGVTPVSGQYIAWLGGGARPTSRGERSVLSQTVFLPANIPDLTLAFYHWVASKEEQRSDDYALVDINGTPMYETDLVTDENTDGWVNKTIDLSQFQGREVTIKFIADINDDDQGSNWFLENVRLCSDMSKHPCN